MGQFGLQAGGGGAVLAEVFHAARPHGDHALQRRVGPQTLGLVDRQRRGVVNQEASVLYAKQKKRRVKGGLLLQKPGKILLIAARSLTNIPGFQPSNGRGNSKDHLQRRSRAAEFHPLWL